jgi:hypothetical protein
MGLCFFPSHDSVLYLCVFGFSLPPDSYRAFKGVCLLCKKQYLDAVYFFCRFISSFQLLDVLSAHFQTVFGITKLQSTLLQLAYFVRST